MNAEVETEWPDGFTREEMLEQQSRLLVEECHMLRKELSRYRKNMAKLIGMHSDVTLERDQLRAQLRKIEIQLSDCQREKSALGNRVAGLESCRDQLEAIHKARRDLASSGTSILRGDLSLSDLSGGAVPMTTERYKRRGPEECFNSELLQ